ncbi:MAG: hypothetical protein V1904_02305, partial [Bacteroidota bacterium]
MKLKKVKADNFGSESGKTFRNFEIEFDGKITRLVGCTGAGKTGAGITILWTAIKGISEKDKNGQLIGERSKFIGSARATSDVEVILVTDEGHEIIVHNHISTAQNQITFTAPPECQLSATWLNDLLSVAFLSEKNFCSHTGKEQAILLGIDTGQFDKKIADLKTEFTLINRDLKNFGEIIPVEKIDSVDVLELTKKKEEIRAKLNKKYLENKAE